MKIWKLFFLIMATFSLNAQPRAMKEEIGLVVKSLESYNNEDAYLKAINLFDKWCKEDPKNWLPHYYASLARHECYYSPSRKQVNTDTKLLSESSQKLSDAMKLGQNEELVLLKAYYLLDAAIKNPSQRSAEAVKTIQDLLAKARALNGSNPRLFLMEAMFSLIAEDGDSGRYTARDLASQAYSFFEQGETAPIPFAPIWGKQKVEDILKRINE